MRSLLLTMMLVAGLTANQFQRWADQHRNLSESDRRILVPSAEAIDVATLGYSSLFADLYWIRAVLVFSKLYSAKSAEDILWLDAMLDTVSTLDPKWRTVYFHGGSMLRVVGAYDESDQLFLAGHRNLPNDPYFPFSIGMNAYLYHKDYQKAAKYFQIAAKMPDAPAWYAAAAAGMMNEGGQRRTAIIYLRQQFETASSEEVRESLRYKLTLLLHEEFVEHIDQQRQAFIAEYGRDIGSLDELGELPPDPFEVGWIIAPDGKIRSAQEEERLWDRAQQAGRQMLTDRSIHQ
ncbi:MAG: hypothetical protein AAFV53_11965 [Myxococcota bacterium]